MCSASARKFGQTIAATVRSVAKALAKTPCPGRRAFGCFAMLHARTQRCDVLSGSKWLLLAADTAVTQLFRMRAFLSSDEVALAKYHKQLLVVAESHITACTAPCGRAIDERMRDLHDGKLCVTDVAAVLFSVSQRLLDLHSDDPAGVDVGSEDSPAHSVGCLEVVRRLQGTKLAAQLEGQPLLLVVWSACAHAVCRALFRAKQYEVCVCVCVRACVCLRR